MSEIKKDILSGAVVAITGCMHNIKIEDELNFSYFLSKLKFYLEEVFIYYNIFSLLCDCKFTYCT